MNVAIYARYSTDKQDARSIEDQVRRCREHAKAKGWTVSDVFADEAISGSHRGARRFVPASEWKTREAPELAIIDAATRQVTMILTPETKSPGHSCRATGAIELVGLLTDSKGEVLDTTDCGGRI